MTDGIAAESVAKSVFAERENLTRRSENLDKFEKLFADMSDEDVDTILSMADVFMRAANIRARRVGHGSPCGQGHPCGQR